MPDEVIPSTIPNPALPPAAPLPTTLLGGVTATLQPPQQPQPTATPVAPQPVAPAPVIGSVTLTRAEYDKLLADQGQLSAHAAREAERATAAENARIKAIADKDGMEAALKAAREAEAKRVDELNAQIQATNAKFVGSHKSAALMKATAGTQWVSPEAARAATDSLSHLFQADEQPDGTILVRERGTLRPIETAVPELLKTPAFSFYLKGATGGVGTPNSMVSPGVTVPDMVLPSNPGQEAFAHFHAQRVAQQQAGYGAIGIPGMAGSIPVNMADLTRRN